MKKLIDDIRQLAKDFDNAINLLEKVEDNSFFEKASLLVKHIRFGLNQVKQKNVLIDSGFSQFHEDHTDYYCKSFIIFRACIRFVTLPIFNNFSDLKKLEDKFITDIVFYDTTNEKTFNDTNINHSLNNIFELFNDLITESEKNLEYYYNNLSDNYKPTKYEIDYFNFSKPTFKENVKAMFNKGEEEEDESIESRRQKIKDLGVKVTVFGDEKTFGIAFINALDSCYRAFKLFKDAGHNLPKEVVLDDRINKAAGTYTVFRRDMDSNYIEIFFNANFFRDHKSYIIYNKSNKQISTNHIDHVVIHELCHHIQVYSWAFNKHKMTKQRKDLFRNFVSNYAATNTTEFMAEYATLKIVDPNFQNSLLDKLFREFGGVYLGEDRYGNRINRATEEKIGRGDTPSIGGGGGLVGAWRCDNQRLKEIITAISKRYSGEIDKKEKLDNVKIKKIAIEAISDITNRYNSAIDFVENNLKLLQECFEIALFNQLLITFSVYEERYFNRLNKLIDIYDKQPNLQAKTSTSEKLQQFSTPIPISYIIGLWSMYNIEDLNSIYEPTAGNGLLFSPYVGLGKKVVANELDKNRILNLEVIQKLLIENNDYNKLTITNYDALMTFPDEYFDLVVMNPPYFSFQNEDQIKPTLPNGTKIGNIDQAMIFNILESGILDRSGYLIALIGNHNLKKDGDSYIMKDLPFFQWLYKNYFVVYNIDLNGKLYSRQGAAYPFRLLIIKCTNDKLSNDYFSKESTKKVIRQYPPYQFGIHQGQIQYCDTFEELYELLINGKHEPKDYYSKEIEQQPKVIYIPEHTPKPETNSPGQENEDEYKTWKQEFLNRNLSITELIKELNDTENTPEINRAINDIIKEKKEKILSESKENINNLDRYVYFSSSDRGLPFTEGNINGEKLKVGYLHFTKNYLTEQTINDYQLELIRTPFDEFKPKKEFTEDEINSLIDRIIPMVTDDPFIDNLPFIRILDIIERSSSIKEVIENPSLKNRIIKGLYNRLSDPLLKKRLEENYEFIKDNPGPELEISEKEINEKVIFFIKKVISRTEENIKENKNRRNILSQSIKYLEKQKKYLQMVEDGNYSGYPEYERDRIHAVIEISREKGKPLYYEDAFYFLKNLEKHNLGG